MPTVIETNEPAPKFAARVDEQLAEATSRIRGHDLAFGGLLVGGLILAYAAGMMLLDKSLVIPEWVRQLSLLGFLAVVGAIAYRTLVRPLRQRVNPLYAAVAVERTIDDAKNSVVGYVEARERGDVHAQVKAAMGARAARAVDEADVNRAVDHRSLVYAGGAVVALFLTLVVLFFVFRPTQFQSLLGRAFAPFSSDVIASRTQITLTEPQSGDVTVTSGQSVTVKVEVTGTVPKPDRPDKMRLLLRYAPNTPYDELPLEPGETSREWYAQLRPEQLRTGAWYKVAGGDAETAEYRVTVRTAPLFTDFEVSYDFPAYLRKAPETATDTHLQAIRNTKVSVTAKANRPVRDGRAAFEPPGQAAVAGKAVPGRPDALRFDFLLTTPGSYKLTFTAADGERSPDSLPFGIKVDEDHAPTVEITRPEPDDITFAANGLLSVDGAAGDDYGLDKMTLKLKLAAPVERPLADRPYLGGKSFRRESDGTYPRSLVEYKDSVDLGKVTDPAGGKVELKEGMVLEYWLEATDNRTKPGANGPEPDPNVGKSKVKRVRLAPPVETPQEKEDQDNRREQRKAEEQKHAADQQQKLNQEDRGPPPPQQGEAPKTEGQPPMPPDMGNMPPDGMPKKDGSGMNQPEKGMNPKTPPDGMGKQDGMPMPGAKQDGMPKQDGTGMPNGTPMNDGMGMKSEAPQQAPMPSEPGRKDLENQANKVQDQLNQERTGGGGAKSPPTAKEDERTTPADQKTNPPTGGMPQDNAAKQNDVGMGASETRPEGKVQPPEPPSTTKTEPKGSESPMGGTKSADQRPSEKRSEPLGGDPGMERETPKGGESPMGDPMMNKGMPPDKGGPMNKGTPKTDPGAGGEPKPATQQKGDQTGDPMMGMGQPNPADGAGKAKTAPPTTERGADRDPQPNPMGGAQQQPNPLQQEGGDPKTERGSEPGSVRPMPKQGDPGTPEAKGNDAKDGDPMNGAAEPRPGPMPKGGDPKMGDPKMGMGTKSGMPEQKGVEPGIERPNPSDTQPNAPQQAPMPKSADPMPGAKQNDTKAGPEAGPVTPMPMGKGTDDPMRMNSKGGPQPKLDAKQKADLEQAARDLNSKDPAKQQDAREKLDSAIGKEARQKAEDIAKGLNSTDPSERERAERQLDELRRQAEQMAGKEPDPKGSNPMPAPMPSPKGMGDPKASPMDNMNPKGGPDPKGGTDMDPKGGPYPKADPKEIENALRDLNSKDEAKQKAARDTLDKTVGEQARREAEQLQNDLNSNDPERRTRAKERLDEMRRQMEQQAKNNPPGKGGKDDDRFNPSPGGVTPNNAKAMDDDPRNRAKSAQLNLDQFEKNRYNRDLQDRLGWTQEEYDRFLEDYRREADRLRRDADEADRNPPTPTAPTRPDNINAGGKIDRGPNAGSGPAGVGGPAFAAPGFGDALRRFQEGATRRPPPKQP